MSDIKKAAKDQAKKAIKKAAKQAVKKGIMAIAQSAGIALGPIIAIVIVAAILIFGIIGFTYSSMPEEGAVNGITKTIDDEVSIKKIQTQVEKSNLAHLYNVNIIPNEKSPLYPRSYQTITYLADYYRQDQTQILNWDVVQAIAMYKAIVENKAKIDDQSREQIATELEPYFYYKPSKVTVETMAEKKDSNGNIVIEKEVSTQDIYLLVESSSLYGWYQYKYETVQKKVGEKTTVTYEKLKDIKTINKWGRLDDVIKKYIKAKDDKDLKLIRMAVIENAKAWRNKKENTDWILKRDIENNYISSSMIPPELKGFFQEAESKYKIPWWFLAAVAYKESSFNPFAENNSSGAYGLMQLLPENWEQYSKQLGFDSKADKDNPRAQILTGTYMLAKYGLDKVDWENKDDNIWQKQTLLGLRKYGGFVSIPVSKRIIYGDDIDKWCEEEYAKPIWIMALKFKNTTSDRWPVPSSHKITSLFNEDRGNRGRHQGLDIAANEGSEITSISYGVVTAVGWDNPNNQKEGFGFYIVIRDGANLYYYAHLKNESQTVNVGDSVSVGQKIAEVGNTGYSTGPHLHLGVKEINKGVCIDPLLILTE